MKIALLGYGKMGKTIEQVARQRGHEIALIIDQENVQDLNPGNLQKIDVAIEFSTPESAFPNVMKCLESGTPTVVGTTGWLHLLPQAQAACRQHHAALLVSSNFSIGVNLFFAINSYVAQLMDQHPEYRVSIEEIHHTQKKDRPSGTAITLAEQILSRQKRKTKWVSGETGKAEEISITSKRIDPVPGTHTVLYNSEIDTLEIKHTAHSRMGFANGAVWAAEFLQDKTGIFEMRDVLGL
jgi:4-hydroxy-tetrahydrodipicolinate reductase